MKTIRQSRVLYHFDGPQIIECRDVIGGHYVGVRTDEDGEVPRFVVAGVTPEALRKFRMGTLDLRSLLLDRPITDWFMAVVEASDAAFEILPQMGSLLETDYLPEEGFFLHETTEEASAVLAEARARHNLVLEISAEPPEAATEHRIRVETLTGLLVNIQSLIKHAYSQALKALPLANRQAIDRTDQHLLDVVVPAVPGSFKVILEAVKQPDLLGQTELSRAMARVDEMFALASNPHETLEAVKSNRGHFSGAYARLLRFLVETDTSLRYQWAEPNFTRERRHSISGQEARPIVDLLSGVSNLGSETVELVGSVEKVDIKSGTWRISVPEGVFSGKTKEGGPSLAGITTVTKAYKFVCLEEIEELGSGREQKVLYLTEHEPMD